MKLVFALLIGILFLLGCSDSFNEIPQGFSKVELGDYSEEPRIEDSLPNLANKYRENNLLFEFFERTTDDGPFLGEAFSINAEFWKCKNTDNSPETFKTGENKTLIVCGNYYFVNTFSPSTGPYIYGPFYNDNEILGDCFSDPLNNACWFVKASEENNFELCANIAVGSWKNYCFSQFTDIGYTDIRNLECERIPPQRCFEMNDVDERLRCVAKSRLTNEFCEMLTQSFRAECLEMKSVNDELDALVEEGFFHEWRSIKEIREKLNTQCQENYLEKSLTGFVSRNVFRATYERAKTANPTNRTILYTDK